MDRPTDCMTWERTGGTSRWDGDQILVFGYSAKLFKDDEQAGLVEQGRHLVPCQGQADLRIDRFDVRGCLSSPQSFEPEKMDLTPAEVELEKKLDEERFRDLISDEVADAHEEEIKRLRDELASDGAYNQVAFSYDADQIADKDRPEVDEGAVDEKEFSAPANLILPVGLNLPKTMRDHKLIEKTALFVHLNGPQMEIVLKIKQSSNPAFSFLNFDSPLNQYFRYILSVIKSGKYVPNLQVDEVRAEPEKHVCDSESDDEDGGYLHPSLMGGSASAKVSGDASSKLNISGEITDSAKGNAPVREATSSDAKSSATHELAASHVHQKAQAGDWKRSKFSILPPPPQEVQLVIDKLAEKVAQAGDEFESSIKRRADPRFEFLNPGNCFHAHYLRRKLHYIEENQKLIADSKNNDTRSGSCSARNISFSFLRTKSGNKEEHSSASTSREKESGIHTPVSSGQSSSGRQSMSREKQLQEERKRKAALFLSLLKSREQAEQQAEANDNSNDKNDGNAGSKLSAPSNPQPHLPQKAKEDRKKKRERSRRSRSRDRERRSRDRSYDRTSERHGKSRRRSRSRSP